MRSHFSYLTINVNFPQLPIIIFFILGVMTPDEFVDTKSTQPEPEEGFLGFFSTLSTEEMIALACGGAGFLLFIIVIIVIIFKLRKKAKRKKKKSQSKYH